MKTRKQMGCVLVAAVLTLAAGTAAAQVPTPGSGFLATRWDLQQAGNDRAKLLPGAGPGYASWSIMPQNIPFAAGNPDIPAHPLGVMTTDFDNLLPGQPGVAAGLFAQAIAKWNAVGANITLVQAAADDGGMMGNGVTGSIRAGVLQFLAPPPMDSQPEMDKLAHASAPDTLAQSLLFATGGQGGDIHFRPHKLLDPQHGVDWVDNPMAPFGKIDLLTVMIHEIGHALGLDHNDPATGDNMSVMNPVYSGPRRDLSMADKTNLKTLYAPAPGTLGLMGVGLIAAGRRRR